MPNAGWPSLPGNTTATLSGCCCAGLSSVLGAAPTNAICVHVPTRRASIGTNESRRGHAARSFAAIFATGLPLPALPPSGSFFLLGQPRTRTTSRHIDIDVRIEATLTPCTACYVRRSVDLADITADGDLPWAKARGAGMQKAPSLVLAWSLDEPDRVGEIVP